MQPPGQDGGDGDGGHGGEQSTRTEEQQHQPDGGGSGTDREPGQRSAQHAATRGLPVPPGHPDRDHREGAEGEAETVEGRDSGHRRRLPAGQKSGCGGRG
ncbi:hypothetical protein STAFG_6997 [Streptomyces afghaniensis 772]|uniref:Uncharacterized protein n=1 Tax=Streptomyces afghaniensis 772 TaxID=1283301 RepID=S4MK28_9ACTN|nr:hypothetical protein STAFG_6997 [Streptomyces afghaniensis 772]